MEYVFEMFSIVKEKFSTLSLHRGNFRIENRLRVKHLIESGAEVNSKGQRNYTSLLMAIGLGLNSRSRDNKNTH